MSTRSLLQNLAHSWNCRATDVEGALNNKKVYHAAVEPGVSVVGSRQTYQRYGSVCKDQMSHNMGATYHILLQFRYGI